MKAAGIVILFPLISVVIVSLYVHGGEFRVAAIVLLAVSIVGMLTGLVWKIARRQKGTEVLEKTSR